MFEEITKQARQATEELVQAAHLKAGDIFVVGCSTSEVAGHKIGSYSNKELAEAIFSGIYPVLLEKGIYLAAQCCEHLNRSLVIERAAAEKYGYEEVNVVPQPKAGGSFATTAYEQFCQPTMVENIRAKAGIDIGGTLIGMHLAPVAVPTRLSIKQIGEANIICARVRPKFVGGSRAVYNEALL
ncbi:MAG: TIGR01440 family protein [Clostridiales bacterium]|nr:MAG: TIGR01440 family protein [Clostridiales bacterium]